MFFSCFAEDHEQTMLLVPFWAVILPVLSLTCESWESRGASLDVFGYSLPFLDFSALQVEHIMVTFSFLAGNVRYLWNMSKNN